VLFRIRATWRAVLRREKWEQDLQDELRSHVDLRADDLMRSGLPKQAAERQAQLELGSRARYKDETRAAFGLRWLDELRQDARYTVRSLSRSPGFTLTAILSVALGVGANTVVFSVLNSVLFRPLPGNEPGRLLFVQRGTSATVSYPAYRDLRDRSTTIEGAIAYRPARMGLDGGEGAERYWGYLATGNYFDLLGVKPVVGRFFHAADENGVNARPYVVLSYDLWRGRFRGDTGIVGRTVRVNALPYTVLGVAPRGFRGTEAFLSPSLWVPMMMEPQIEGINRLEARDAHSLWMLVRMKPGVTPEQAQADLNHIRHDLTKEYPRTDSGELALAKPGLMGDQLRKPVEQFVTGVMIAAGLVLLAACANLAGLLGARSADRFREIAVRVSIGAGRWRIFRQLLTESVVLTTVAGAIGCAVAWFLLRILSQWIPPLEIPVQVNVSPDIRVFLFALAVSVLTGILAGLAPARQAWRTNPNQALKGAASGARSRLLPIRDATLVLQTALCCVVVVCSLVAGRGLLRTFATRPGFEAKGVSVVGFDPTLARYSPDESARFQRHALDAVSQLSGVTAAAYAKSVPLTTDQSNTTVFPESAVERRPGEGKSVAYYDVSPGYFKTMGTRLLAGREFDWRDTRATAPIAIVNETFARQLFGTADAVGKRFRSYGGLVVEIAAVAEDGKYSTFTEDPKPVLFRPILQQGDSETVLLVRSSFPEAMMGGEMARAVKGLDPAMPVYGAGSLADTMGLAYLPAWVASIALGAFGVLAVMLAVTGIYGVASYSVARRSREIGVRIAIGARRRHVLQCVLGRLALLVVAGSGMGLVLGLASGKLLASVVYQASPRDPITLTAVGVFMLVIAGGSALGPMRRAVSMDPMLSLRQD
jgi:predicted permease